MGTGLIGLFMALYINQNYPHVSICMIDNRIYKEGIKQPYTRLTQFEFDISEI